MNGEFRGTVDRIVDGETAVVLIEEDGEVTEQFDVATDRLPEPAREAGGVLAVTVVDGAFEAAEYRSEATEKRRETVRERLDRLSRDLSDTE
ncbi:DUF3006 domain-containing protein [Halobacteria archaeon AArc-dxtr1]|nr:DUF3006 domain-containing protein [Halobacteria archaeon AArc-dxtr1]